MVKKDYYKIGFLLLIPLLVFFPIFYTSYFYTDEVLQLWLYREGSSFAMFVEQGRLLNDRLFRWMYSHIQHIDQLKYLRCFSLAGWLLCIPVWYSIFSRVTRDEGLHPALPFFSVLFLVCSLPFGASVQWAACMELFIANTSGLLAGYCVYRYGRRGWLPALLLGLLSLFFYQNGFGCYWLPFFLIIVSRQKADRKLLAPLLVYLAIYFVYFLLFKGIMKFVLHSGITNRANLLDNPLEKAYYLFSKILPEVFYFNAIVYEKSILGRISFVLIAGVCLWLSCRRLGRKNSFIYSILILGSWVLIYLPSMVIHENYASNRTLLALDMAVLMWVFTAVLRALPNAGWQSGVMTIAGVLIVFTAVNNFRNIFLRPAVDEYTALKGFIDTHYHPDITSIDFIRSSENAVRNKYAIQSSWDEYGMSSSYFPWVPDAATRQLVFERTHDRARAEKLVIRVWADRAAWEASGQKTAPGELLIDANALLKK